jgi:cell wall-associated NlpC family hydrolase
MTLRGFLVALSGVYLASLATSALAQSRTLPALSSRGSGRAAARAAKAATPKTIKARVGKVAVAKAEIRSGKSGKSSLLYSIPEGTNLAIVEETEGFYGVLMVNQTIGWVKKSALEIVDGYQTEVTLSSGAPARKQPEATKSGGETRLDFSGAPENIQTMLRHAFGWSGVRYVWGGESRNGIDCSAFVRDCYRQLGIELPRVSADQAEVGVEVDWSDLKPGDRLYFDMKRSGRVNHCGIYIGNGYFIHASSNQGKVGVDSLFKSNYYRGLTGARRR